MKKRFLSLLCVLALCLGLLPVTALAAEGAPSSLYVGNQQVISGNDITYWTTGTDGKLTASNESGNWNVKYDPSTVILSLQNAKISGGNATTSPPYGAGIYALSSSGQPVALTIELIGENTITGTFGIYVNAEINASSYGTNATLTIMGDNNGSLEVSGSNNGIYVKSGTGNASLNIKNVAVTSSTNDNYAAGVYVMSSNYATNSPNISLSVDGGSLTASGTGSRDGILFYVGSSQATGATTSLTVSENAIVDARNGGISALKISETLPTPTPTGDNRSGIVFDGTEGTVYGDVTLDESLTIEQDETLTIPSGSSLNANGNLTNNGTILASGGTVTGSLSDNTQVTTPTISVQPQNKEVTAGETATFTVEASAGSETPTYQWQQKTAASGSDWTDINSATSDSYTTEATTTSMNNYQYRCVVTSASGVGVISNAATLTVQAKPASVPVTGVKLNKTELTLTEGNSETLTATVEPSDATNQNVTWNSSDGAVATVDTSGNVTAVAPGTAAITVTTADGNKTAVCTVTVSKRSSSGSSGGSDSEPSYSPILETEGEGTVKVDPRTPGQGDAVTVTPTPDRGWDVGSVTVTDRNGREIDVTERRNSTWTFEQPRGRVTIAVTFVPAGGTAPFADVPEGHWAEAAIRYVWENGLMNGTSAASFNPGGTVSRQQVWMILARMAGADPADMAAAKAWAVDSGISDGTSPGGAVTRQQFAALLYRFAVMMGYDVSVGESTNILSYADAFDAAEYAIPALQWACGAGIIHGTGDGSTLSPQGTATRAQAAVMLERFCELNK